MSRPRTIRVMISSRCNDLFPASGGRPLSKIRKDLKAEIEGQHLFGQAAFDVWINETAPPSKGSWDSIDVCVAAVKDCDILLVLSNGNAGWATATGDVGICHLELSTAHSLSPDKVRLVYLGDAERTSKGQGERNGRFQDYVHGLNLFRGGIVSNEADLKERVFEALFDAVLALVQSGVREINRARYYTGAALDWNRLILAERRQAIATSARQALLERSGATAKNDAVALSIAGKSLLFIVDAVPAVFGNSQAREMVGQPQLRDHERAKDLGSGQLGPIHLLACHRTAPEATVAKLFGSIDATAVSAPFGTYIVDPVQMTQVVCITNCRDDTNTRNNIERFLTWLVQSGEDKRLLHRAGARSRIVKAIAKETSGTV